MDPARRDNLIERLARQSVGRRDEQVEDIGLRDGVRVVLDEKGGDSGNVGVDPCERLLSQQTVKVSVQRHARQLHTVFRKRSKSSFPQLRDQTRAEEEILLANLDENAAVSGLHAPQLVSGDSLACCHARDELTSLKVRLGASSASSPGITLITPSVTACGSDSTSSGNGSAVEPDLTAAAMDASHCFCRFSCSAAACSARSEVALC